MQHRSFAGCSGLSYHSAVLVCRSACHDVRPCLITDMAPLEGQVLIYGTKTPDTGFPRLLQLKACTDTLPSSWNKIRYKTNDLNKNVKGFQYVYILCLQNTDNWRPWACTRGRDISRILWVWKLTQEYVLSLSLLFFMQHFVIHYRAISEFGCNTIGKVQRGKPSHVSMLEDDGCI